MFSFTKLPPPGSRQNRFFCLLSPCLPPVRTNRTKHVHRKRCEGARADDDAIRRNEVGSTYWMMRKKKGTRTNDMSSTREEEEGEGCWAGRCHRGLRIRADSSSAVCSGDEEEQLRGPRPERGQPEDGRQQIQILSPGYVTVASLHRPGQAPPFPSPAAVLCHRGNRLATSAARCPTGQDRILCHSGLDRETQPPLS